MILILAIILILIIVYICVSSKEGDNTFEGGGGNKKKKKKKKKKAKKKAKKRKGKGSSTGSSSISFSPPIEINKHQPKEETPLPNPKETSLPKPEETPLPKPEESLFDTVKQHLDEMGFFYTNDGINAICEGQTNIKDAINYHMSNMDRFKKYLKPQREEPPPNPEENPPPKPKEEIELTPYEKKIKNFMESKEVNIFITDEGIRHICKKLPNQDDPLNVMRLSTSIAKHYYKIPPRPQQSEGDKKIVVLKNPEPRDDKNITITIFIPSENITFYDVKIPKAVFNNTKNSKTIYDELKKNIKEHVGGKLPMGEDIYDYYGLHLIYRRMLDDNGDYYEIPIWQDDVGEKLMDPGMNGDYNIKDNDTISLRRVGATIEPVLRFFDYYNLNFSKNQKKLESMKKVEGAGFRYRQGSLGDNNCYYRSIIMNILRYICKKNDNDFNKSIKALIDILKKAKDKYFSHDEKKYHDSLISILENEATNRNIFKDIQSLECEMLKNKDDHSKSFDLKLIKAFRVLLAEWLDKTVCEKDRYELIVFTIINDMENYEEEVNEKNKKEGLSPIHLTDLDARKEYYMTNKILKMGVDIEGSMVDAHIMTSNILKCKSILEGSDNRGNYYEYTNYLDDKKDVVYDNPMDIGTISILLQPGHYDAIYI